MRSLLMSLLAAVLGGCAIGGSSSERELATSTSSPFDPTAFTLELRAVASGFDRPVFVTHAGDGSRRLFVVEKAGAVRVMVDGRVLPDPFLDITPLVMSDGNEQGLLGLAFHPDYERNGFFYVAYTAATADETNTVARYRVSAEPNRADPTSASILLAVPDDAPNHNGGMLAFGPDGYLYVGMGDGGFGQSQNGQDTSVLLGKLLRLDVDSAEPYAIPPDNPFVEREGFRPEIWAYGLRNPWRFGFDRLTGDLWIGDVGGSRYEEIDLERAGDGGGHNYGWAVLEGDQCNPPDAPCDQTGKTPPIHQYDHDEQRDNGCTVVGGYVYRGSAYPLLAGGYFFADYCRGFVWSLDQDERGGWTATKHLDTELRISSFGEDEAGELYLVDYAGGAVYQLTARV